VNIICPYVPGMLWSETHEPLHALGAEFVDVSADEEAYYRLLASRWAPGNKMIVVEQDVVPTAALLERMWTCPRPWCVAPYVVEGGGHVTSALGCVKFSGRLMARHPKLMERVGALHGDGAPLRTWWKLGDRVNQVLAECMGVAPGEAQPHLHFPAVQHLS